MANWRCPIRPHYRELHAIESLVTSEKPTSTWLQDTMQSISIRLNRENRSSKQMKSVFGRCTLKCSFSPLPSLPSIPPSLAGGGEGGRPPLQHPRGCELMQPGTPGPSQAPQRAPGPAPPPLHPPSLLVGCSQGTGVSALHALLIWFWVCRV